MTFELETNSKTDFRLIFQNCKNDESSPESSDFSGEKFQNRKRKHCISDGAAFSVLTMIPE